MPSHNVKSGSPNHVCFADGGQCETEKRTFSGREIIDKSLLTTK